MYYVYINRLIFGTYMIVMQILQNFNEIKMTMSSVSLTISTSGYSVSEKFIQLQNLHTVDVSLS